MLNQIKPVVSTTQNSMEVQVAFWIDDKVKAFSDAYYAAFSREMSNSVAEVPFTSEEFHNYVIALIALKIRKGKQSIYRLYHAPETLNIPAMLLHLISKIGPVVYDELGIRLTPIETVDNKAEEWNIVSEDDLKKVSDGLEIVRQATSIEITRGLPNDRSGDLAFMLTSVIKDSVVFGEVKSDDVLLSLASIVPHRTEQTPRFLDGISRDAGLKSIAFIL